MNRYVIAFINLFDFHLDQMIIEAKSPTEAIIQYLRDVRQWEMEDCEELTVEELRALVSECDCSITYVQV
jgi:hypothetical protein